VQSCSSYANRHIVQIASMKWWRRHSLSRTTGHPDVLGILRSNEMWAVLDSFLAFLAKDHGANLSREHAVQMFGITVATLYIDVFVLTAVCRSVRMVTPILKVGDGITFLTPLCVRPFQPV